MTFLKQLAQLTFALAFAALIVLVVLPNYPDFPKILTWVALVLLVVTLPYTLNRWKNVPRAKVLLLYAALFVSFGGVSLSNLFALDSIVALLANGISLVLLIIFMRIKPKQSSVSSRN